MVSFGKSKEKVMMDEYNQNIYMYKADIDIH